jgi:hypothetical protein
MLLGALAALAADTPPAGCGTTQMQLALDCLAAGDCDRAEQIAMGLTEGPASSSRAWLVVASARHRRGDLTSAAEAYRQFIAATESPAMRKWAAAQLDACQQPPAEPAAAPSARLSDDDRRELSKVERRTYSQTTRHFIIRARNERLSRLLADEAEAALTRICGMMTGQEYPNTVEINVWADQKEYASKARHAPEWSGASFSLFTRDNGAVGRRIDLKQLDEDGDFDTVMLDRALPHEMCHLVLKDHFGERHCPLVVNEGLAMAAEWGVDNDRVLLAGAALAGRARIALGDLLVGQPKGDEGQAAVFYAEAYSLVSYLQAHTTREQFKQLVENLRAGCAFSDALQRAMGCPHSDTAIAEIELAWQSRAIEQAQEIQALRTAAISRL